LVLVNAIYFNGKWKQPFDLPTEKAEFFNFQSGSLIEMMQLKGELKVQPITELNAQIIELPFDNNQQTLYILLPNENEGIDEMNEKLTLPLLQQSIQTLNNSQSNQIQLFLPKFKIENEYDLREPLEELDAKTLFTDEADLSGISADNSLKLSSAIHHTVFEVNENGVKVEPVQPFSAQIIPDPEPEYRELRVDHPFTFFIYSNGLIVFVGQVRTLVDEQLLSLGFI
jgi:serpin B